MNPKDIVLQNLPLVRPATHPNNEKVQDSLLSKTTMTREECNLLLVCLESYFTE